MTFIPERHWVKTETGWQSHARWRCLIETECTEILMPPKESHDESGKLNAWVPGEIKPA